MRQRRMGERLLFVNAMIEPRAADESVFATLTRAKALIEGRDFESATHAYTDLLERELTPQLRGEVLTNLGAALCLSVGGMPKPTTLDRLDRARSLLLTACSYRESGAAPAAWATTRANLAMVHIARYEATGNSNDLLSAHMALDGTEQRLLEADEPTLNDWVLAIRHQLVALRDRRSRQR